MVRKFGGNPLHAGFGLAVREARLRIGLSQERLAFDAGLHRTYVSLLERGKKSPSLAVISALAAALRLAPNRLIRDAEIKGRRLTYQVRRPKRRAG